MAVECMQVEEAEMEKGYRVVRERNNGWGPGLAVCLCIVISIILATSAALIAAEEQEMPGEIYIENKVYKTDRKGPVRFTHSDHAEGYVDACEGCHHEYRDGENIWQQGQPVKKCVACHDPSKSKGRVKKLNIAYHKNCKGCHKNLASEGEGTAAPYKQCTDCHGKR